MGKKLQNYNFRFFISIFFILNKDCRSWFSELHVDMEKIQEISKYLLNLYDLWKSFDEKKEMSGVLAKMPKPKQQPTHPQMQQNN